MALDPTDPRPEIRALIAWPLDQGHVLLARQDCVRLEDAALYRQLGFAVLVDPADEAVLARWEQLHRPRRWGGW